MFDRAQDAAVRNAAFAAWPVFVVGDDRRGLTFTIAVDDARHIWSGAVTAVHDDRESGRRQYVTAAVRQRLHQRAFRERVLDAYRNQCAFCRFRHAELLDAAHIVPDAEQGEPTVRNGLALCKLHHAAFDRYFVGVRPDYVVEVRPDLLREEDGRRTAPRWCTASRPCTAPASLCGGRPAYSPIRTSWNSATIPSGGPDSRPEAAWWRG